MITSTQKWCHSTCCWLHDRIAETSAATHILPPYVAWNPITSSPWAWPAKQTWWGNPVNLHPQNQPLATPAGTDCVIGISNVLQTGGLWLCLCPIGRGLIYKIHSLCSFAWKKSWREEMSYCLLPLDERKICKYRISPSISLQEIPIKELWILEPAYLSEWQHKLTPRSGGPRDWVKQQDAQASMTWQL